MPAAVRDRLGLRRRDLILRRHDEGDGRPEGYHAGSPGFSLTGEQCGGVVGTAGSDALNARASPVWNYRVATGTSVSMVDTEALEMDDDQSSAGSRSAPTSLLHPWKAAVAPPLPRSMQLSSDGWGGQSSATG
jgi:hypothetical protein